MNANEKPKKLRGGRTILSAFLVCLILADPFVTNCLLIGEVTDVREDTMSVKVFDADEIRHEIRVTGTDLTVRVDNSGLFRWIDRLLTGRDAPYSAVRLHLEGGTAYRSGSRILALIKGGQEDSDPPGLAAWILLSRPVS